MIRFCDKEICCVSENDMDRQQILNYFLDGHRGETICVMDTDGKFTGSITYDSLLGKNLDEAVCRDSLILDETIWEAGRKCFRERRKKSVYMDLLPVIDKEKNLLCFAYQDTLADRELRMLDELAEHKIAAGFRAVFPEYEHVTVYGCNELAYYFVLYLRNAGISIHTFGPFWEYFSTCKDMHGKPDETLDYRNLEIYAEGICKKEEMPERRQSVSAEFECIDKIYEKNIMIGIICDACGDFEEFLKRLRGKQIGIIGTKPCSLDAYDLLLSYGMDICCFIRNRADEKRETLFGKNILERDIALSQWQDMVVINPEARYSAWGFGEADQYHYLGCQRNKRFFLLPDYIEIPSGGMKHVLSQLLARPAARLVLAGDILLSLRMKRLLSMRDDCSDKIVYCDILGKYAEERNKMQWINPEEISENDFCLLLIPQYNGYFADKKGTQPYRPVVLGQYEEVLQKHGIVSLGDYPFEDTDLTEWKNMQDSVMLPELRPGKIMLGAINSYSGNTLFDGILEKHPDIIQIRDSHLSRNLHSFCMRLAELPGREILPMLEKLYKDEVQHSQYRREYPEPEIFDRGMRKLLSKKEKFTSQELFMIIHIAYAGMMGKEIKDISETTVFWEPHHLSREILELYSQWLDGCGASGMFIINIVRDAYIRAGSSFRCTKENEAATRFSLAVGMPEEKKEYAGWKRIVMRFEDLKLKPREEMQKFCSQTGIAWSDKLLDIKAVYKEVTGFDLAPVYRTWEEYFSSFDRFRMSIITGPWQRKYGYPYTSSLAFGRRELWNMFQKKFQFEENWVFEETLELLYIDWRTRLLDMCLQNVRRKDYMEAYGRM